MNTNKKFIGYAKEHFDGTPREYDACCYDSNEEAPLDVSDPNIAIDIHVEGSLDNPMDKLQLINFCKQHAIPFPDDLVVAKQDAPYYSEDAVLEAFEESATEGPKDFFKAAGNLFRGAKGAAANKLNQSKAQTNNVVPLFANNEKFIQKVMNTKTPADAIIQPVQAARYFVEKAREAISTSSDPAEFFVLTYGNDGNNAIWEKSPMIAGDGKFKIDSKYSSVIAELKKIPADTTDQKQLDLAEKLYNKLAEMVVVYINQIAKQKTKKIVGYTMDSSLADGFTSLAGDGGSYEGLNPEQLDGLWNKATVNQKATMLKQILTEKGLIDLADTSIQAIMQKHASVFSALDMKILEYAKAVGESHIDANVFAVMTSDPFFKKLFSKEKMLNGLDLTNKQHLALILLAARADKVSLTFKNDESSPWHPESPTGKPDDMKWLDFIREDDEWGKYEEYKDLAEDLNAALEARKKSSATFGNGKEVNKETLPDHKERDRIMSLLKGYTRQKLMRMRNGATTYAEMIGCTADQLISWIDATLAAEKA
ncbi:MAG: hypothetical protein NC218_02415 [Acetobacter sp.]|nr:hypothetical protein [Acetobacter sp.]